MSDSFSGQWIVEVWQKDAAFDERYVISGSDSSDGTYAGLTGTAPIVVTGNEWTVELEWNDQHGSGWLPSAVHRKSAAATASDGVVVFLGADDNYEQFRDGDYNDLVLRLRSVDPSIAPWYPISHLYDFTLPAKAWRCGIARTTNKGDCEKAIDEREKERNLKKIREQVEERREALRRQAKKAKKAKSKPKG